jgi:hypothetical protein
VNQERPTPRRTKSPAGEPGEKTPGRAELLIVVGAALKHADAVEHTDGPDAAEQAQRIRAAASALIDGPPPNAEPAAGQAGQLAVDLRFVMNLLADSGLRSLSPPRLELSREATTVTAQVLADRIAVPLVGQGDTAPAALRELVQAIEQAAATARRARPRRRRRRS